MTAQTETRANQMYMRTAPLEGSAEAALETAEKILMPNGFREVEHTNQRVVFEGGGMFSSHQSPLLGASRVELTIADEHAALKAELGGVRNLQQFVTFFPPALGLFITVIFLPLFASENIYAAFAPLIATAPWLIVGPLIAGWLRRRTEEALDNLLENARRA